MHEHDLNAHGLQQRDVGHERAEQPLVHHFATEPDDERLIAECVDIRCDRSHPVHELGVRDGFGFGRSGTGRGALGQGGEVGSGIHAGIIMRPHVERIQKSGRE